MELRTTREMRRNAQLEKAAPKKADASASSTQPQPARSQAGSDKLTISRQAIDYLEEMNRKMWESAEEREARKQSWLDGQLSALETKSKQLDEMGEKLDILNKCQKIAAAIMKGDNVPPEDLAYLMEHDQEGFKMAIAMRRPKEDPEDVKSVLDDEDKNGGAQGAGDSGEAPSVEPSAPAASSGGGDVSASAE